MYGYYYSVLHQTELMENVSMAQLKLQREWTENKFVSEVFVVDAGRSCAGEREGAEPLFSYDWEGLRPYFHYTNKDD